MRRFGIASASVDPLEHVLGCLEEAAARHREADERVIAFVREVEFLYANELQGFVPDYERAPALGRLLAPVLDETGESLLWLRGVGGNGATLARALHAAPGPA